MAGYSYLDMETWEYKGYCNRLWFLWAQYIELFISKGGSSSSLLSAGSTLWTEDLIKIFSLEHLSACGRNESQSMDAVVLVFLLSLARLLNHSWILMIQIIQSKQRTVYLSIIKLFSNYSTRPLVITTYLRMAAVRGRTDDGEVVKSLCLVNCIINCYEWT